MPLLVLIFIFIVVPLAELYVIFKVGEAIGVPLTILILAADSVIGSLLLKSQGRAVWRRFSETKSSPSSGSITFSSASQTSSRRSGAVGCVSSSAMSRL